MTELKRMYAEWRGRMAADYVRPEGPDPEYDQPEPLDVRAVIGKVMWQEYLADTTDIMQRQQRIDSMAVRWTKIEAQKNKEAMCVKLAAALKDGPMRFSEIKDLLGSHHAAYIICRTLLYRGVALCRRQKIDSIYSLIATES